MKQSHKTVKQRTVSKAGLVSPHTCLLQSDYSVVTLLLRHGHMTFCYKVKNIGGTAQAKQVKHVTLNFGPNHPAAHGILRFTMEVCGEVLLRLDPQFGFLYRGTEKLFEGRFFLKNVPYFDRFDYVANLFQEHAFCLAVEGL